MPAVSVTTGEPKETELAYGWHNSVALAHWNTPVALTNVENFVSFAKAVYIRKLEPGLSFVWGFAIYE